MDSGFPVVKTCIHVWTQNSDFQTINCTPFTHMKLPRELMETIAPFVAPKKRVWEEGRGRGVRFGKEDLGGRGGGALCLSKSKILLEYVQLIFSSAFVYTVEILS